MSLDIKDCIFSINVLVVIKFYGLNYPIKFKKLSIYDICPLKTSIKNYELLRKKKVSEAVSIA